MLSLSYPKQVKSVDGMLTVVDNDAGNTIMKMRSTTHVDDNDEDHVHDNDNDIE
jgi:hypothetical protein